MQQIHHKRNERLEVEFFEDAECTVPFNFTGKKDLSKIIQCQLKLKNSLFVLMKKRMQNMNKLKKNVKRRWQN